MMYRLIVPFLLLFFFNSSQAQQFGAYPPATKWKQINTDTSRIIFTASATEEAQRVATIIHQMAATNQQLGKEFKKINIVLHNNTTLANGYVGLAPFRSEYYLVPGGNIFDFGNLPWAEQLAIHEYRHVQQYNNFNRGISKGLGYIFGEQGRALANGLAIPDWFFEGDAVYAETVLTPQGRGRTPYFLNGFKSLWIDNKNYSWMKLRNRSLKDFVPNHYPLGFLLTNYGYVKYGPDFWQKVTTDASKFKGIVYPFQQAVKRHSGIEFKKFRKDALAFYTNEIKSKPGKQKVETVTNYYFPQMIGNDSLLYLKDSYNSLPAFYIKNKDGEQKIKLKNISSEDWFSYRNGWVAYTAYSTDKRWSLTDYSDIILLNIATGKEEKLTQEGKYFTPDISPDNSNIIAVSITDSVKTELHLLNRKGEILKNISAPNNSFFVQPRFIDDKTLVVALRLPNATLSLQLLNITTGQFETLLPPAKSTIGFPFVYKGDIYFVSSLSANDEIYRLRLKDKKLFQLTTGETGHYFPNVYADTITFSHFTSNGYAIEQKALADISPIEINPIQLDEEIIPFEIAGAKEEANLLATPTAAYPVTKYKKSAGLFNFHSWSPDYTDPEFSFSVFGDNILSTFTSELFYRYNRNESSHATGFNLAYGGLFPVINTGVDYTFDRHVRTETKTYTLNQLEARVGYSLPFNFTKGKTYKLLNAGSNFVYNNIQPTGISKNELSPQSTAYLHHFLNFTQQLPRARQHIYPKLGYTLAANYRHRLDEPGYQSLAGAQLFLPSAFPTHSIVIGGSFQQTDTGNIIFSNRFSNTRGYNEFYYSKMWKASANYHFPLAYPDIGVANVVYLLRVRSNVFYDHSRVYSKNRIQKSNMRSVGTELFFDTRWWNQLPISIGVRYSYLLDARFAGTTRHIFELAVPIDLIPD